MSISTNVETNVKSEISWLRTHERIVIVALVLAVGAFGLNKYLDVASVRADARAVAAEQVAADAKANSAAAAVQATQTLAQYTALVQALAAQNSSLAASMAKRTESQTAQAAKNATLPVQGVAERWNIIANTLVKPSGDTIIVSNTDAHKTLDMLEQVPTLRGNLADETQIASNFRQSWEKSAEVNGAQTKEISALNNQLTADANSCKLEIAAVKAESRKNKVTWFRRGFIVGLVSGLWLGHAAGL